MIVFFIIIVILTYFFIIVIVINYSVMIIAKINLTDIICRIEVFRLAMTSSL